MRISNEFFLKELVLNLGGLETARQLKNKHVTLHFMDFNGNSHSNLDHLQISIVEYYIKVLIIFSCNFTFYFELKRYFQWLGI